MTRAEQAAVLRIVDNEVIDVLRTLEDGLISQGERHISAVVREMRLEREHLWSLSPEARLRHAINRSRW